MKQADGAWERFDDYVLDYASEVSATGKRFVLVTLVAIDGSAPRPLGAQMVVCEDGQWVGYLSGGCIEKAVVAEALDALAAGASRRIRYGEGSRYFDIQLPCGSAIELYFDVTQPDLRGVVTRLQRREPVTINLPQGKNDELALQRYLPRRRIVIFGMGPSAVMLCRLASVSTFSVDFYSPDEDSRSHASHHAGNVIALHRNHKGFKLEADRRSAIVFMFHDHDWEADLLPRALQTDAFYIGALGSRRTHSKRLEALQAAGIPKRQLGRIRGPAGLFAGSKSAPDIALSILSEIALEDSRQNNFEDEAAARSRPLQRSDPRSQGEASL